MFLGNEKLHGVANTLVNIECIKIILFTHKIHRVFIKPGLRVKPMSIFRPSVADLLKYAYFRNEKYL